MSDHDVRPVCFSVTVELKRKYFKYIPKLQVKHIQSVHDTAQTQSN